MPVINNITLDIDMEQVLRRQKIGAQDKVQQEVMSICRELLADVERQQLLKPAIAYEIYRVSGISENSISLEDGTKLSGRLLPSLLSEARELGVAIGTIGYQLEERASGYFKEKEALHAVLLDGIGNSALDCLSRHVCQLMNGEAASRGCQASSPLSPGMKGWDIAEQQQLFRLVPAEQGGISLTSYTMMIPRKSTSVVIGIGPDMPTWTEAEACKRCSMKEKCAYRISD
ncbi:hypothetical protein ACFLYL_04890 [Chloroflexota bacterium]